MIGALRVKGVGNCLVFETWTKFKTFKFYTKSVDLDKILHSAGAYDLYIQFENTLSVSFQRLLTPSRINFFSSYKDSADLL